MARRRLVVLALLAPFAACRTALPDGAECWSLSGRALYRPSLGEARQTELRRELQRLERLPAPDPDRDHRIWIARHLGYLGRYRDAIDAYSQLLVDYPDDAFVLRHRGHRYLTVREFDRACADFALAVRRCRSQLDEVEPDGLPVPGRPPHSSLHFNVFYHYGLATFLAGDFAAAERRWLRCLAVCTNDESRVAVTHWLWCARMRSGDPAGAAAVVAGITADMDVVENVSYHQLCLLYAGRLSRDEIAARDGSSGAALRFGLAHHDLVTGNVEAARQQFEQLAADPGWAAFGVIAAEAELAR